MVSFRWLLLTSVLLVVEEVLSSPTQVTFGVKATGLKKLRGRFLHITDMHPDPHYTPGSSPATACHRKKPKKKKNRAHYYGTPFEECDSPLRLTNLTLDFLDEHWSDDIDFVIWTGDNARHDNDRKIPRTPPEIYQLNRAVASRMEDIFSSKGIPVVPSLGNNDIWPHNILTPGPNAITNEYASIWNSFIPFPYLQVFQRGAYYSVEVIPDELAVISLNTLYFYDSNKVVPGCAFGEPHDPGNLQFDWLEVQLKEYRERHMQVWITGHVPPSPGNYFPECYVRYAELALRFQDTILGHLFGHMNVDHFFFLEAIDLQIIPEARDQIRRNRTARVEGGLFQTLLREFSALPKAPKEEEYDNYVAVNVAPAVVPNPYVPAFRIYSYNTTGNNTGGLKVQKERHHGHRRGNHGNKSSHCETEDYKDSWKCHLDEPWFSTPDSPSRSNKRWTPLGYAQYYMPTLAKANESHPPRYELEYLTYSLDSLHPEPRSEMQEFTYPIPLKNLPEELRENGLDQSKYAPYRMSDLTIPSWIRLAGRLADGKHMKLQEKFRKYMFFGGKEE